MTQAIIPLRPRDGGGSSLARIDAVAVEILSEGRATDLQTARIEAILMDLRVQRDRMATVLTALREGEPVDQDRVSADIAGLIWKVDEGMVQIDLFIERISLLSRELLKRAAVQSSPSTQTHAVD